MSGRFGVIIPAAGSGLRFGSDKLMYDLCGEPVLRRTVRAFQEAETVGAIVIPTRKENVETVRELTADFSKVVAVVEGGATRTASVLQGLQALPADLEYVSVHDGARPLILSSEIDALHRQTEICGAVCAGSPVYDTIQQVDGEGNIVATPDRSTLMAAATPQAFRRSLLAEAYRKMSGADFTDDAGLVRAAGGTVKMVLCQCDNFKITTPRDAALAEMILSRRKSK